jgi:competence protein ComEC
MIRWIPYAFIRIVFFFMLGIIFGIYYPNVVEQNWASLFFLLLVGSYGIFVYLFWKQQLVQQSKSRLKFYAGVVGLAAIFLAGFINVLSNTDARNRNHLIQISSGIEFYKAVVISSPQQKGSSWRMEAAMESVKTNHAWENCEGKILLYISNPAQAEPFQYGDVLLVKGQPQLLSPPSNPEEFDYKRFLSFKNIYHHHFTKVGDAIRI